MADKAITEIYAEIQGSSDRTTAIVSAAFIEDRLQRAIWLEQLLYGLWLAHR
jgi:hypothetical protein